jgi:TetR/AcrR family transcriptional regulator, transcriptional repressor for nem operon
MPRPRSVDDEALLPKAMWLFWSNGYANTGIRELEHALGLKAPSLYNRFGSKESLFHAALAHYLEVVVRFRIERYLRSGDALRGLRRFFDTTYEHIKSGKPALSCLLVNTSIEVGSLDAKTAALLAQGGSMIRDAFNQTLARAQREGSLRKDADLEALADAMHLGLQGLLVRSRLEPNKASLKRLTDSLFSMLPLTAARKPKG